MKMNDQSSVTYDVAVMEPEPMENDTYAVRYAVRDVCRRFLQAFPGELPGVADRHDRRGENAAERLRRRKRVRFTGGL